MKKVITYTEEQVSQIGALLNGIVSTGVQSAKSIAVIAQILDSGMPGDIKEPVDATKACNAQSNAMPAKGMG
ncbi:MAG: hypothetical protein F8N38_15420 [Hungatella sp.]|nr:hypothetical protein [Hungatella sp.]